MRCGGNCHECHWCTTGTVTDVVTMMWDVFKRLGVEEARLADPFQLSRTDGGRRMLAEGRGAATPPARPPKSTSSSARPPATLVPGYASSRWPGSGRIEETGGRDVRDSHPYPPVTTPAPPPPRPRSTTSSPASASVAASTRRDDDVAELRQMVLTMSKSLEEALKRRDKRSRTCSRRRSPPRRRRSRTKSPLRRGERREMRDSRPRERSRRDRLQDFK